MGQERTRVPLYFFHIIENGERLDDEVGDGNGGPKVFVAVVFCCHGCVGKFNQSRIGTYQPGRPRSTQATLALLGAAARPPLLVVHLPQPCPFEPQPPSRGELLHRLFAAWRHPCARPELGRRDMEGGEGPMPPAHLGPARNAHQRADDSFAAGDEKMVGGSYGSNLERSRTAGGFHDRFQCRAISREARARSGIPRRP